MFDALIRHEVSQEVVVVARRQPKSLPPLKSPPPTYTISVEVVHSALARLPALQRRWQNLLQHLEAHTGMIAGDAARNVMRALSDHERPVLANHRHRRTVLEICTMLLSMLKILPAPV
jgi:hypothetical protein